MRPNRTQRSEVVLLLDDRENIRRDLGDRLRVRSFSVHTAASAEEARKIILSERIDYAIVDLAIDEQSELGGVEVVNFLKRNRPEARAIVLSAWPLDGHVRPRFEVEIDGYVEKGGAQNYISAVLTKLTDLTRKAPPKKCFVIMPFSTTKSCTENEWTEIFSKMIKPSVERPGYGYLCERSSLKMGNIIEEILDSLNRADVVIADMTDRNPNVFYELGIRHALRNATILISQNLDDIPFDLRPYATHIYKWKLHANKQSFAKTIKGVLSEIETGSQKVVSPVRKYLKID
jgi:ActR/RegA family two-component response regulator